MSWFSPPSRGYSKTARERFMDFHASQIEVNSLNVYATSRQAVAEAELVRRLNRPESYPQQPFVDEANKQAKEVEELYTDEMIKYCQRVELPAFSIPQSLPVLRNSTHAPPHSLPSMDTSDATDPLLALPTGLLYQLLSFVPSFEFFLLVPRLSQSHFRAFCQPQLHQRYGRERFSLSDKQWRLFSESAWPRLSVPIWQYAYHFRHGEFDGYIELPSLPTTIAEQKREVEAAEQTQSSAAKKQHIDTALYKDWACECFNLYQHILFASLHFLRTAPNVTSTGAKLEYRLPATLIAMIVDSLTSHHLVDGQLNGLLEADCRDGADEINYLFLPRYTRFAARTLPSSPAELVAWDNIPSVRPSTEMECAALALWEAKSRQQAESDTAVDEWWNGVAYDEESLVAHCTGSLPLVEMNCGEEYGSMMDLLMVGPALSRAIETAPTGASVITVDLTDSPVIRFEPDQHDRSPVRVVAASMQEYVAAGGMDGRHNKPSNDESEDDRRERQQRRGRWLDRNCEQPSEVAESEEEENTCDAEQSEGPTDSAASRDDDDEAEDDDDVVRTPAHLATLHTALRHFLRLCMFRTKEQDRRGTSN